MHIEKISLKALTVGILLLLGLSSIALTLFSGSRYQQVALDAQSQTLSRVLEVAARESLGTLRARAAVLGQVLQKQPQLRSALADEGGDPARRAVLSALLDAGFDRGTVGAAGFELLKLRSYGPDLRLIAASSAGIDGLPTTLPPGLDRVSADEVDAARPRDALWSLHGTPYYSLRLPVGDGTPLGYLEIVAAPVASLRSIQDTLQLPFSIGTADGTLLYRSEDWHAAGDAELPVHHALAGSGGGALLELKVIAPVQQLYTGMAQVRSATAVAYLILTGGSLILAIGLFRRFLFRPVEHLMQDMQRAAEGELQGSMRTRALQEFNTLATTFDRMRQKLHDLVERERQHAEDVTGKVELIQDVVQLAARGDLTGQLMVYRDRDVISGLATGIQGMLDSLNNLVARIQQSGIQVTSSATEIAATAKQQEATVSEQAATTNEIRATVTEISATSKELVNTMHEVTDVAFKTAESANTGRAALGRMEETMRTMMEATAAIGSKLAVLSEKAGNINTVVTTINKVSDQTNLLSLNAAIEAEKAGEYGVGFAVVATEIRRLADQTAVATWDIEQMVKEMQSAVSAGVMGMEKFSTEVRQGVDDVRRVGGQLAHIIEQVEHLIPRFEEVHEGMQSQSKGAQQISEAMVQLADSSQQTAESLRQSNGAIVQLNDAARRLQEGVSHFKVNKQGA